MFSLNLFKSISTNLNKRLSVEEENDTRDKALLA